MSKMFEVFCESTIILTMAFMNVCIVYLIVVSIKEIKKEISCKTVGEKK